MVRVTVVVRCKLASTVTDFSDPPDLRWLGCVVFVRESEVFVFCFLLFWLLLDEGCERVVLL